MMYLPLKDEHLLIDHYHCYYTYLRDIYEVHVILFHELENNHRIQLHYIRGLLYNVHPLKKNKFIELE